MRGLFTLVCGFAALCVALAIPAQKIHERMTPGERMQAFQTADENVQNYEVVPIHWPKVEKRSTTSGTGIYLKAFGDDIKLWLKPTDGILAGYDTPVYVARSGASGPKFAKYSTVMKHMQAVMYEDLESAAALVVTNSRFNNTRIIGTVRSKNLVITPIPERFAEEVKRQRRSIDNIPEAERGDHHYHIVYKQPLLPENAEHLAGPLEDIAKQVRAKSSSIPDTVYPEVLVIVANDLYKKFDTSMYDTVAYLLAFWNGVDLKYRNFENPKFRLNIAGIVLVEDADALSYIAELEYDKETLIVEDALKASSAYWYDRRDDIPINSYDAAVTMTSHELCAFDNGRDCTPGILGLAFVGGACKVFKLLQLVQKTAIIQDKSGFDGIHTAAHELGHLLGAMHDGVDHKSCPFDDGYIMAGAPVLTEKSSDWSKCSLKDIQGFLDEEPVCIYNKPVQEKVLPRYLPGKYFDADKQCKILEGTKACKINADICQSLGCIFAEDAHYCKTMGNAAAAGTKCGEGKICLHGECISEKDIS